MKNVKVKKIIIKRKEGLNFAKLSGDNNPIHISKETGNKSQFGENIVHGSLALIKILKKIKIKNFASINTDFLSIIKYNLNCEIKLLKKSKKKVIYKVYQEEELKIVLEIFYKEKEKINKLKKTTFKKKIKILDSKKKSFYDKKIDSNLKLILSELSKYVGVIYPGKYSLINKINIIKKKNFSLKNLIYFKSNRLDKRFNLIDNNLHYNQFFVDFKTSIRPTLKVKLKKPNKRIIREIKNIKNNILIIGGSSGIGNDLLKLVLNNKKIKIISTYNNNKIKIRKKNLKILRVDVTENIKKIFKLIKRNAPLNIYYFATPIINTTLKNKFTYNLYYKYFVDIPLKLVKYSVKHKSNFFYPSTIFINNKNQSYYSLLKNLFEKRVKTIKKNKNSINILRIPRINTKHNLSMLNEKLPNFREIILKNEEIRNFFLFNN